MPTNRRRRHLVHRDYFDAATSHRALVKLVVGSDLVGVLAGSPPLDDADLADAWEHLKARVMEIHLKGCEAGVIFGHARPAKPGSRPPGWWVHEAPEPIGEDESELAYLRRLGLLSVEERRLDAAGDLIETEQPMHLWA